MVGPVGGVRAMDLFEETERVKLLLVKAYARLQRLGHITAEELDRKSVV